MKTISTLAAIGHAVCSVLMALGVSQAAAAPTSLEVTGTLLDGSGNRINANFITFANGIYDSPTGGTLMADLGTENVHVWNGSFLQVFNVDDSLFESTAFLQVNLNGFDMAPRLSIFFTGSYFVANGIAWGGPAGVPLFQLFVGIPLPEPAAQALSLAGLVVVGAAAARRRRTPGPQQRLC